MAFRNIPYPHSSQTAVDTSSGHDVTMSCGSRSRSMCIVEGKLDWKSTNTESTLSKISSSQHTCKSVSGGLRFHWSLVKIEVMSCQEYADHTGNISPKWIFLLFNRSNIKWNLSNSCIFRAKSYSSECYAKNLIFRASHPTEILLNLSGSSCSEKSPSIPKEMACKITTSEETA